MHSEQSCTDLGQMYVAIYQSTFVKCADQTHHMVSGMFVEFLLDFTEVTLSPALGFKPVSLLGVVV